MREVLVDSFESRNEPKTLVKMINLDKLGSGYSELLCVVIHVIVDLPIYFQQLGYNLLS